MQRDLDETTVRADAGIVDSYRLAGTGSLAARLWTKPSVTVIGFDAHPVEGSFNVISPETTFRLSLRTAPNQRPQEAQEALAEFMVEHAPFGAEVWVDRLDNGMGWAMDPDAEATKDAMEAMERPSVWRRSTRARAVPSRSFRNCSASSRTPGARHRTGGSEGQCAQPERVHQPAGSEEQRDHRGLLLDKLSR